MNSAIVNCVVIDLQCFRTSEDKNSIQWTPKELAIYDGKEVYYYLFKAPFPLNCLSPSLKREAIFNMKYHHGIHWSDGSTPIEELASILQITTRHADVVYVKGAQKAELLRKYVRKPVLELMNHPKLTSSMPACCYHNYLSKCVCALSNVYSLYDFYIKK